MFAVIKTGGKQYKVSAGDRLKVERLPGKAGETIDLRSVLLINNGEEISVGSPLLENACVRVNILEQTRDKKIIIFKKKRRKGYRRKAGHRQDITLLQVQDILENGREIQKKDVSQKEKILVKASEVSSGDVNAQEDKPKKKSQAKGPAQALDEQERVKAGKASDTQKNEAGKTQIEKTKDLKKETHKEPQDSGSIEVKKLKAETSQAPEAESSSATRAKAPKKGPKEPQKS